MAHHVCLIPGDGIGPEITAATIRVLEATGVSFVWHTVDAGVSYMAQSGDANPLPDHVLETIRKTKVALKAPIGTPVGTGFRSVNVALRQGLDLFACVRPCKHYPGIVSRYGHVDLVIVRENTEDLYAGLEFDCGSDGAQAIAEVVRTQTGKAIREGSAISLKPISRTASERIVAFAFDYAVTHGRHKVTVIHKANIMKCSDGLFLSIAREVASRYPSIEFEEMIVDAACMNLVIRPESFDVLVTENLYGDILSDLCAGLVGGLGVAPGANIGTIATVFEATHGTAPTIAGMGIANPLAMILSGKMMLDYLGETAAAERLEAAVVRVLQDGCALTNDLAPKGAGVSTNAFADAIITAMMTATVA